MSTTATRPARWQKKRVSGCDLKRAAQRVTDTGVIMRFEAVISTPAPDRDGDILHPEGAEVDTSAPLLWQHDTKSPIGKLVAVTEQNAERLCGRFVIADTDLGADAAKLTELGCLRISHGFHPLEFTPIYDKAGKHEGGYDIKRYTVLEVSLVSVPSNVGAVVTAFERGELKSAPAQAWAKSYCGERANALWRRAAELEGREPTDYYDACRIIAAAMIDNRLSNAEFALLSSKETMTRRPTSQQAAGSGKCECGTDRSEEEAAGGFDETVQRAVAREMKHLEKDKMSTKVNADELIANAGNDGASTAGVRVRVKGASESFYSTKRRTVEFTKAGLPARGVNGRPVEEPSDWDKAQFGCFMQWLARKSGVLPIEWTEHHQAIMGEMIHKNRWHGEIMGMYHSDIGPDRVKSLLDDTVSGGSYINPEFFDDQVITPALLSGELFPHIEVVQLPRASSVATGVMQHPTVLWTNTEGTAGDLFNTADLIAPLTNTVRTATCFMEVGLDFMADTPINVGNLLSRMVGEKMQEALDYIVANGDGSTQPLGIFNTPSITEAPTSTSSAGPVTVGAIDSLIFSIPKQNRTKPNNCRFVMSDSQYRHCRDIPLATGYNQRVFDQAMNNSQGYTLYEWPVSIQNDIAAGSMAFCALRRYRMYRRAGLEIRWTSEGKTLTLSNMSLLSMRSRWAGQLTLPVCCAVMTGVGTHQT